MCNIRLLRASEIEVRVQQVTARGGAVLLLYKSARCDMAILDEVFGTFGWQREHSFKEGKNYCRVSIRNAETGEWIAKEDVGTESNTDAEKGQASDAFKRACTNVGIGRELYTSPFIFVNLEADEVSVDKGRMRLASGVRFEVYKIEYEDRAISRLVIVDGKGYVRFSYTRNSPPDVPKAVMLEQLRRSAPASQSAQPSEAAKGRKQRLTVEGLLARPELLNKLTARMFEKFQEAGCPETFDPGFFIAQYYTIDTDVAELFKNEFEKLKN